MVETDSSFSTEVVARVRSAARTGERIRISYRNAQGELSERTVLVNRVYTSRSGRTYLQGYCFLAEERRTFRLDRIRSIDRQSSSEHSYEEYSMPASRSVEVTKLKTGQAIPPPKETLPRPHTGPSEICSSDRNRHRHAVFPAIVTLVALILAVVLGISSKNKSDARNASPVEIAARRALDDPTAPFAHPLASRTSGGASSTEIGKLAYRGLAVETKHTSTGIRYEIPALGVSAPSLRSAYLLINQIFFERRSGIHDLRLEAIYSAADVDGNGHLSWAEIVEFQTAIYRVFSYKKNRTALRPGQFLDARGGDCEDWALFTAGLLHFWGWNASIATFDSPRGGTGHALVFVWVPEPIPGIGSYTVPAPPRVGSTLIPPGTYVPIDYENVGGFSDVVEAGWHLTGLYDPESLYGRVM